jgi:hypothetical protein
VVSIVAKTRLVSRLKLKVHAAKAGGVYFSKDAAVSRLKLRDHRLKLCGV